MPDLRITFWVPGKPKPKARARASATKNGKVWMRDDERNPLREGYIRDCFQDWLEEHPEEAEYLPLDAKGGIIIGTIWALYPPPEHWHPGMVYYLNSPDHDNLSKLVWDALAGRGSGRPSLLCHDDKIVADARCVKLYWNPTAVGIPGYPQEPGTLVDFQILPVPRDPGLLPPGEAVCPRCGKDEFKDHRGWKAHVTRCTR